MTTGCGGTAPVDASLINGWLDKIGVWSRVRAGIKERLEGGHTRPAWWMYIFPFLRWRFDWYRAHWHGELEQNQHTPRWAARPDFISFVPLNRRNLGSMDLIRDVIKRGRGMLCRNCRRAIQS